MSTNKYREIKNTETQINDRLLKFIIEKKEIEDIVEELNFASTNLKIELNKPPLDNWISSDYIKLNGNTFIDEFLELYSHTLKPLEIEILNQKLISHISMFEILRIDSNRIYIEDNFDSKFYTVIDESIGNVLLEGDFILARVAKVRGEYIFIGDIEYVPSSIKNRFLESIFIHFNRERFTQPNLELQKFLKRYSLDIYSIYRDCLIYHMDDTEDDIPVIISDITEFQEYALDNFPTNYHIHMTNLMEIFEYGLMDKELSLQDINEINLDDFFKSAIKDGFINSKEDYNSYLETLKIYLTFLGPGNPEYKESYNHIIEISKNRFKYMSSLKNTNFNYKYDRMLVSTISNRLNQPSLTLVGDLDRFLIYVMEFEVDLTPKRKEIKKKELLSLNKLLKLSNSFNSSRPSQSNSQIINLLYHLSLDYNLTKVIDNNLRITDKGKNFFKLKDEEKYAVALSYIFSLPKTNSLKIDNDISHLETGGSVFTLLGMVEYDKNYALRVTSLGKIIYKYMESLKDDQKKIIDLKSYKEKKIEEV